MLHLVVNQPPFPRSTLTMETPKQSVKFVQSEFVQGSGVFIVNFGQNTHVVLSVLSIVKFEQVNAGGQFIGFIFFVNLSTE